MTLIALLIAMDKLRNRRRHRLWASGKYGGAGFGAGAVGGCAAAEAWAEAARADTVVAGPAAGAVAAVAAEAAAAAEGGGGG